MEDTIENVNKIIPVVRNYDWGVNGKLSLVRKLYIHGCASTVNSTDNELENLPYAELWIGDHDSAPCRVISGVINKDDHGNYGISFEEALSDTKSPGDNVEGDIRLSMLYRKLATGTSSKGLEGCKILMKVLSIAKPLSLQLHPDPESALQLYMKNHPGISDNQAKPEMSVALCRFRALCGLRPLEQIKTYAQRYPPFAKMLGNDILSSISVETNENVGELYMQICKRILLDTSVIQEIPLLVEAVKASPNKCDLSEEIFLILNSNYGVDVSISFAFLLNCLEIESGEAFFIPPNTLHSYISGNCVELMNNSDNVIRCGLTSKKTDIDTFLDLINVEVSKGGQFPQAVAHVNPICISPSVVRYSPEHPTCSFEVWKFVVKANSQVTHLFDNGHQPFLCVVMETNSHVEIYGRSVLDSNKGSTYVRLPFILGDCFFISSGFTLDVINKGTTDFVLYLGTEKWIHRC
ncbi:Phosphomannose isomerase type I family protein [Babesia bovis T2Bo]|uniref:mannose-6-phosphate isomerase n=1 Tax=Babesia bovis TaxID=5865 RepID=A7APN6_BABBO|nr:Phosphomannose isomerase type I family protein [Babesia bovis T2Bo]EDO08520.1 Phosphomannose isomerase type I family protein [Babesia bovis T2Bo]|eukprot:XP_001612088.1 phosphomannose isomerase type I family protein [Babesia bovis T2Bo]